MRSRVEKTKYVVKDFFKNFASVLRSPNMIILPGNIAFYFVLSIIPTLSLISFGASKMNLSISLLYNFLSNSFSQDLAEMVLSVHLNPATITGFIITTVAALFLASNGADAIIVSSNTIYEFK